MQIQNLENKARHYIKKMGNFSVLEYERDLSVDSSNAMEQYFMGAMGLRRRQLVVERRILSGAGDTVFEDIAA